MRIYGMQVITSGFVVVLLCWPTFAQTDQVILTGCELAEDAFIGLNTSDNRADWLRCENSANLRMDFPGAPSLWGAVFIQGPSAPPSNRLGRDVSTYRTLEIEMSGDAGTTVQIGIKDASQPDDGSETKIPVQLTSDWKIYQIPLSSFLRVDLKRVYILTEFVFGSQRQTVRVRSIKYTGATTTKVLPQFAFGGGWYSALYFTNTTSEAASLQLSLIGEDGLQLPFPFSKAFTTVTNLAPNETVIIEAPNTGPLTQGYVSVSLPSGVVGYGVFRQSIAGHPDQEAVVPLSSAVATKSALIWDDTHYMTAIALVNPSSQDDTVAIVVRDTSGQPIGASSIHMPARSKTSLFMRSAPGLGAMIGKRGSAEFSVTSGAVAVLGLRFNGLAFTSIPAADD